MIRKDLAVAPSNARLGSCHVPAALPANIVVAFSARTAAAAIMPLPANIVAAASRCAVPERLPRRCHGKELPAPACSGGACHGTSASQWRRSKQGKSLLGAKTLPAPTNAAAACA